MNHITVNVSHGALGRLDFGVTPGARHDTTRNTPNEVGKSFPVSECKTLLLRHKYRMIPAITTYKPRPAILLLGDSLTQLCWEGWGAHLSNVYQRRADVINRGLSGYNTKFFLQLPDETIFPGLQGAAGASKCSLVILWFGANDTGLPGLAAHHHVSLEDYRKNLHALLDRVQRVTACPHILLLTPPPVHHGQRLAFQKAKYGPKATGELERTLENTGLYAAVCKQVANERDVPCCDIYHKMQESPTDGSTGDWSQYLHDGLHFSPAGHAWLGETLVDAINDAFPDLSVTADARTSQWGNSASLCPGLPGNTDAPFHDEINHVDIPAAFGKYHTPA